VHLIRSIGQYKDGAYSYNNRFNFNSRFWRKAEIIKEIRKIPSGTPLYTNLPEPIYIFTGRSSYKVPYTENALTKKRNEKYLSQLEAMDKEIIAGKDCWYISTRVMSTMCHLKKNLAENCILSYINDIKKDQSISPEIAGLL